MKSDEIIKKFVADNTIELLMSDKSSPGTTVFYMPHCEIELYCRCFTSHLLSMISSAYCVEDMLTRKLVIIGNSLESISEISMRNGMRETTCNLAKILFSKIIDIKTFPLLSDDSVPFFDTKRALNLTPVKYGNALSGLYLHCICWKRICVSVCVENSSNKSSCGDRSNDGTSINSAISRIGSNNNCEERKMGMKISKGREQEKKEETDGFSLLWFPETFESLISYLLLHSDLKCDVCDGPNNDKKNNKPTDGHFLSNKVIKKKGDEDEDDDDDGWEISISHKQKLKMKNRKEEERKLKGNAIKKLVLGESVEQKK
jgi:hypothetical protein